MDKQYFKSGYSEVKGLNMYYEIYGEGKPLVLIHGGGLTIQMTFQQIIPPLSKRRQIIAMELQAHGRTGDRDSYLTFKQDADDIAGLLENLGVQKADFLGFSNGSQVLIEIALRHPDLIDRLIMCSSFYKRCGTYPQFWEEFDRATPDSLPDHLREGFLKVNNNVNALSTMFNKVVQRIQVFEDWTEEQIKSIQAPTFLINGTADFGTLEHTVEMYRLIPDCELAILPGGHGDYIGVQGARPTNSELTEITVALIEQFLNKRKSNSRNPTLAR